MTSELTPRQWTLYRHLTAIGDKWTCQQEICNALADYYPFDGKANFHDSSARHDLTADIRKINKSAIIQKPILSTPRGVKISTEADFEKFIKRQYAALWRKKELLDGINKKGNRDGQMRIVFGSERDTVKAFLDSDKDFGNRLKDARNKAGFYQQEVVQLMWQHDTSFDAPLLSKFENGYCLPNKTTLYNLAHIYGVSVESLTAVSLSTEMRAGETTHLQAVKDIS